MPGFLYQWPLWLVGALMTVVVLVGFSTASLFVDPQARVPHPPVRQPLRRVSAARCSTR